MTKISAQIASIKGPMSVTRKLTDKITAHINGEVVERDTTTIPLIDGT